MYRFWYYIETDEFKHYKWIFTFKGYEEAEAKFLDKMKGTKMVDWGNG